jgi:hypothetical protein
LERISGDPETRVTIAEGIKGNPLAIARNQKDILGVMERMAELELKISRFYKECGDHWEQEKEFWSNLEKEEVAHAESIRKMEVIFQARPERFEGNRTFSSASVSVALSGVQDYLQKLEKGQLKGIRGRSSKAMTWSIRISSRVSSCRLTTIRKGWKKKSKSYREAR